MLVTEKQIEEAYSELKGLNGGTKNDYFGLIYLQREFKLAREEGLNQIALGGNDYGFDGFHIDTQRRNLYLFQFKNSPSHSLFKASFQRLIEDGMARVFGAADQDKNQNELIRQLKSALFENKAIVDRVYVRFVFTGDPAEAERSSALERLREELENRKHLLDTYFGRPVNFIIEFRSAHSKKVGTTSHQKATRVYEINLGDNVRKVGPGGELLCLGFVSLPDLHSMYKDMNQRFFDRNIRASLDSDGYVNKSIQRSLKNIMLDETEDPSTFAFNHNGVTLSAEHIEFIEGSAKIKITEPRLLNGAQTVSTYDAFISRNQDNPRFSTRKRVAAETTLLCKIITKAHPDFVTTVTINNNRQNPVHAWNLHANDLIQLELQDKFVGELGVYYERQEKAFSNLSDDDLEDAGITDGGRPIELIKLAQTFLVSDGEIDKYHNKREVFESDKIYSSVFNHSRLKADSRKIVLCYKVQFRLNRLINEIVEKGQNKYAYMGKARALLWALLCQGILNDENLEWYAEQYGKSLSLEAGYTAWLAQIASRRCRFLIGSVVSDRVYADKVADGNYAFLRTNAAYQKCMNEAGRKFRWGAKKLK